MRYLLIVFVLIGIVLGCDQSEAMKKVKEKPEKTSDSIHHYEPSQPIAFSHAVHAGINDIDCKYCHNSVTESKSAGLPSVNVCMNCHKQIKGTTEESQKKISEIYEKAGWDGEQYTSKTTPIVWNRVHDLPDSVYFNGNSLSDEALAASFSHAKHIQVSTIDCKSCHGDFTQKDAKDIEFNESLCSKCHY